ncbi:TetR/AcrR family transcriptional regulator [Curvivirga sp.]|uniref:TetR/AcrR family transcriptional regulator n=1 Tax=Curvivirga sp. TaxID=2856848 RepID=UPI003B58DABC
MARPSLKDQRSEEILDAYVICAARFGLEGATQERIAEQAGVQRTILRHYLGNKDDMLKALAVHVIDQFQGQTELMDQALQASDKKEQLLDILFASGVISNMNLVLVYQALVARSEQDAELKPLLLSSLTSFISCIEKFLKRTSSCEDTDRIFAVTQGVIAIYFNKDAYNPLHPPQRWEDGNIKAANLLLELL